MNDIIVKYLKNTALNYYGGKPLEDNYLPERHDDLVRKLFGSLLHEKSAACIRKHRNLPETFSEKFICTHTRTYLHSHIQPHPTSSYNLHPTSSRTLTTWWTTKLFKNFIFIYVSRRCPFVDFDEIEISEVCESIIKAQIIRNKTTCKMN